METPNPNKVPQLRGEFLYIPFVLAIIQRELNGKRQIVVQTRQKETDLKYSGSIEIPGGKFRAFEDIYETLKREVKEECGLDITFIRDKDKKVVIPNRDDSSDIIEPFCVTQMKNGPYIGLVFLCEGKGELLNQTNETKNSRWMDYDKLKDIVENNPEKIYTACLAPLVKFFAS